MRIHTTYQTITKIGERKERAYDIGYEDENNY